MQTPRVHTVRRSAPTTGGRQHERGTAAVNAPHRLALAHDYLIQMGGAERVVASMVRRYPGSPLYTSAVRRGTLLPEFAEADIRTSWMQRLPGIESQFKKYFALYPCGFRSFNTVTEPTLWVSASTFAKCLPFSSATASVLYCHNPTRFLWLAGEEYVDKEVRVPWKNQIVRSLVPWLRRIDFSAAQTFDVIVANSEAVRKRIAEVYHRDATVIHPPVQVDRFTPTADHDGYYIVVSRLVAYKALERAVIACSRSGRRLVVVGEGPDRKRLEALAGPTVFFAGWKSDAEVKTLMERSRGLIFPAVEDFGIAPVEAHACGKPVIAFAGGGALETVAEGQTGCFFHSPTPESALEAIERSEKISWNPGFIRGNAERFCEDHFHYLTSQAMEQAEAIREQRVGQGQHGTLGALSLSGRHQLV